MTKPKDKQNASEQPELKELEPLPDYIGHRQKLWDQFRANYLDDLSKKVSTSIKVNAKNKDGEVREVEVESWKTTPIDVAKKIGSKSWAESVIISKVDGKLWDLERPLEKNCSIEFLTFDDNEGKAVFWHSTAHVMGEALERLYGSHLCYGPPIEDGFYYDMYMNQPCCAHDGGAGDNGHDEVDKTGSSNTVREQHFSSIEKTMEKICGEKQPFERLELSKEQLLEMFSYNQFKVRILKQKVKEDRTTVYRCGSLIDLCLGPHVKHTGLIKALKVTKVSI